MNENEEACSGDDGILIIPILVIVQADDRPVLYVLLRFLYLFTLHLFRLPLVLSILRQSSAPFSLRSTSTSSFSCPPSSSDGVVILAKVKAICPLICSVKIFMEIRRKIREGFYFHNKVFRPYRDTS